VGLLRVYEGAVVGVTVGAIDGLSDGEKLAGDMLRKMVGEIEGPQVMVRFNAHRVWPLPAVVTSRPRHLRHGARPVGLVYGDHRSHKEQKEVTHIDSQPDYW
jgi:hypothetical protein